MKVEVKGARLSAIISAAAAASLLAETLEDLQDTQDAIDAGVLNPLVYNYHAVLCKVALRNLVDNTHPMLMMRNQ